MPENILWEIADMVELLPHKYFTNNDRSFIYGTGYITDISFDKDNKKIFRIDLINAKKQYLKNFAEVDIGEYVIIMSEKEINSWFCKLQ
jgi:hypothetical protein